MLFNRRRVVPKYMDFAIVYYWDLRHDWTHHTITKLNYTTIEDAIEKTRPVVEERIDYKLAMIYKDNDRYGTYEFYQDNLIKFYAFYKRDIRFDLALFDPDEYDPERKVKRDTPFIIQKNYLAEFRTSGHEDIKLDIHRHEIYADTLEECFSKAKQKLWEVFAFRYSCIYAARADKFRGQLIKIIGKVNDTHYLDGFEFEQYRNFDGTKELYKAIGIYELEHMTPKITNENILLTVTRPAERYSQALDRDMGDIKEVADCDKEGFLAVSITSTRFCMAKGETKRLYVPSEMLEELKKRLKTENLKNNSVVYWHNHENVVYRIFPNG